MKNNIRTFLKAIIPASQRAELRKLINKIRYYGFRYECPMCGSHLRKMHAFGMDFPVLSQKKVVGGGHRLNAQCPVCRSVDRERLLYIYLLTKTNVFTEQVKLLHVAPEHILSRTLMRYPNIDYLTADLNSNSEMVKMDITDIKYPDNSFDIVICNHVLEHIIEDTKAMKELHRVLKPEGWGILQVPMSLSLEKTFEDVLVTDRSEREKVFGQWDHVRIYASDYYDRLKDSGFKVHLFNWWENLNEFGGPNNRFSLIQNESIIFVTKAE